MRKCVDLTRPEMVLKRLDEAVADSGLTQAQIADALNTKSSTVAGWLPKEGRGKVPGGAHLAKLPGVLGVSGHWLLAGVGPKHYTPARDKEAAYDDMAAIVDRVRAAAVTSPRAATSGGLGGAAADSAQATLKAKEGLPPGGEQTKE